MTNFSENPGSVKVEFYKPGGKWYMTEELIMGAFYDELSIHDAIEKALVEHKGEKRAKSLRENYIISVAEPYHRNAHPVLLVPDWMFAAVRMAEADREAGR